MVICMNWEYDLDGVHLSLAHCNFNFGWRHVNYIVHSKIAEHHTYMYNY